MPTEQIKISHKSFAQRLYITNSAPPPPPPNNLRVSYAPGGDKLILAGRAEILQWSSIPVEFVEGLLKQAVQCGQQTCLVHSGGSRKFSD